MAAYAAADLSQLGDLLLFPGPVRNIPPTTI